MTLPVDTTLLVIANEDLSGCGAYTTEFLYADGTALTGDPFSYSDTAGLTIESSDATTIGTHNLTLQVYLTSYPTMRSNILPITVTIVGLTCPLGTASYIPSFNFDRTIGDS